ncbi:alpha-L-rhamnosidase N-terminal domain-containing protein [Paraglaciecola sp.]|uniref:alpha-L-rhamnosidase-related protein n=1 Tax=Paraglaciecola sp. TaxID=1920173 RepID=UPI003EF74C9E
MNLHLVIKLFITLLALNIFANAFASIQPNDVALNQKYSPESTVKVNHQGKEFTKLKFTWKAQWITHPTESTLDARKFLFRRTFDLSKQPENFIIHLSADNRYRLYVNGQYLVSGPSIADINHYRYETLDIAQYLSLGANSVAVEVVNFGEYRKASTMTFQTAFILQGDKNNLVDINTGADSGWKVTNDTGFSVIPFMSADLRGYYAAGPGESLNSSLHPWGWRETGFDDSSWLTPKLGTVEFAVGQGFLYGSTWYLTPRTIPFMEETKQRFVKIARSENIEISEDFIKGTGTLTIPANKTVSILIDQTQHSIGHPVLHYSKGSGSQIKMTYSEALFDKNWKKGHRNEYQGKKILGYFDKVTADGGNNRQFKPLGQKTYRFIQLDITTQNQPLVIDDYYGVYTAYPFQENAQFETDNPVLSEIWDAAWLSLRNSSVEGFIDPYYEQLQYIGDTRIEALAALSVSGDDRLMRKAIEMFDNSRLPNGLTASRYPSYIVQIIPTYSLLWINMIHDFTQYKHDDDFVRDYVPGMRSVLNWWIDKVDTSNNSIVMPKDMRWWNFTDWTPEYQNGIPFGADDGYSTSVALQFVKTLQYASEMFSDLGYHQEAKQYAALEKQIIKSVMKHTYVKSKGLFAETPNKQKFSQHTNIMAILTDAIPQNAQKQLMEKILSDKSLIQTTIYYKFYLFNALHKVGLGDRYTQLLENWTNQLDMGLTTFAEKDIEPRSDCHAWSASPNYHFLKIVAGIYPAAKHFDKITVAPHFGELTTINAKMPHPKGEVSVKLTRRDNSVSGEVILPKGTSGTFNWQGKTIALTAGKQVINQ